MPPALPLVLLLAAGAPVDDFELHVKGLLARRCLECHSGDKPEAGLDLAWYDSPERALEEPDEWLGIHEKLVSGEMPPEGHPRPSRAELDPALDWIEERFGIAPDDGPIDPGRPVLRRLNHTEYRNTVRDLFGVDFPVDERFPSEGAGHGFDTVGEALSMSDVMFEKYLDAAEWIARRAVVPPEPGPPRELAFGATALAGDGRPGDGVWVLFTSGEVSVEVDAPRAGEYLVRARAWAQQAGPDPARMELTVDGRRVARFDVTATRGAAEAHVAQVELAEGRHRLGARFTNDYYKPDATDPADRDRNLLVEALELSGPLDPPLPTAFQGELLRRFGPDLGRGRLRAILSHLAERAWRRPPEARDLGRLERLVRAEQGLEAQLRLAVQALVASPAFLFRLEPDPEDAEPGAVRALDSYELATRLSYFLWSTTPDAELLELARRGALADATTLLAQTARLIDDPRSRALADGFAAQWLQVRALERAAVDPERFPAFDDALRAAMREETLAGFDALLREDRSVWELVDGDTTLLNEDLARHYGVAGVAGPELRRVSLFDTPRRGLLGQASVLTLTSDPTRTSPVKRGKWILEVLLGAPPPPPPPGAGTLDDSAAAAEAASLRERLERHRADPACAVCHDVLDPLGFGLEPFDAVGAWRESDGRFPIDASGVLPDGRAFSGPVELAAILRADDGFLRNLAERLFVYATGRGLERADRRAIDALLARLDPARPTLRALVEGVVLSEAFRMRRVPEER